MSHNSGEGISEHCIHSNTDTQTASSPESEKTTPPNPNSSSSFLRVLPDIIPANPMPSRLACPVSVCSLVFKGEMPHGYLWRHLNHPGIHGRTGEEKEAWLHLHKIERDRLLATRLTPAERKREANRARSQKVLRTVEFELRAREMGITERASVEQKVAIWEGMYATEQNDDTIEYFAWVLLDFCTSPQDIPQIP
ncbi:hypothetical protein HOY80DRAFT_1063040 [Tuber brumale]|nr:hypothetical protein HOY80DRAFT_1063040 [Tuber brumale]